MAEKDLRKLHYLHFLFHFATEFLQVAEIVNRLRRAARLQRGKALPENFDDDVSDQPFHVSLAQTQAGLRTAEELAQLPAAELKALVDGWNAEALALASIVWAKYADTMDARSKRLWARRFMSEDPDARSEARKARAAAKMGLAGPKSIDRLLTGKKAQGGVYEIDPRLIREGATVSDMLAYLVPPAPIPPRAKRRKR